MRRGKTRTLGGRKLGDDGATLQGIGESHAHLYSAYMLPIIADVEWVREHARPLGA